MIGHANNTAKTAITSLDSMACFGLNTITEQVPYLRSSTGDIIEDTKDTAASLVSLTLEYAASFSIAQISLYAGDNTLN